MSTCAQKLTLTCLPNEMLLSLYVLRFVKANAAKDCMKPPKMWLESDHCLCPGSESRDDFYPGDCYNLNHSYSRVTSLGTFTLFAKLFHKTEHNWPQGDILGRDQVYKSVGSHAFNVEWGLLTSQELHSVYPDAKPVYLVWHQSS